MFGDIFAIFLQYITFLRYITNILQFPKNLKLSFAYKNDPFSASLAKLGFSLIFLSRNIEENFFTSNTSFLFMREVPGEKNYLKHCIFLNHKINTTPKKCVIYYFLCFGHEKYVVLKKEYQKCVI